MTHILIAGITESGKTLAAKRIVREAKARGVSSLVLDPMHDPEWNADYQTANREEFLEVVRRSTSCLVVVDEGGEMIGRYNDEMFWLATKGRHWGHKLVIVTQRPQQINKTVRDQCTQLWLFTVSRDDAKILANEFNKPELETANELQQFEYFHCGRFVPVRRGRITFTPRGGTLPNVKPLAIDGGSKT